MSLFAICAEKIACVNEPKEKEKMCAQILRLAATIIEKNCQLTRKKAASIKLINCQSYRYVFCFVNYLYIIIILLIFVCLCHAKQKENFLFIETTKRK